MYQEAAQLNFYTPTASNGCKGSLFWKMWTSIRHNPERWCKCSAKPLAAVWLLYTKGYRWDEGQKWLNAGRWWFLFGGGARAHPLVFRNRCWISTLQTQFVLLCGDLLTVTKLTQEFNLGKEVNSRAGQLGSAWLLFSVSCRLINGWCWRFSQRCFGRQFHPQVKLTGNKNKVNGK